jgi:hypothetical protein
MGYIEMNENELYLFDSPNHFKEWLIELHNEYDLEEIEELKQLVIDLEMHDFYLVCKEFEQNYLNM